MPHVDVARSTDLVRQLSERVKLHNVSVAAAGVAFFALIALVPALVATISIYGIVSDPEEIEQEILDATEELPEEVSALLAQQMSDITGLSSTRLGIGGVVGIVLALWSASAAVKNMFLTLNVAYGVREERSFVRQRSTALVFTLGAVLIVVLGGFALMLLPSLMDDSSFGPAAKGLVRWFRLPALAIVMVGALMLLYRFGPSHGRSTVLTRPGAVAGMAIFMVASIGFGIYSANVSNFNETYGSLGVVIVMMLWLYLGSLAVVVGGELNALLERRDA